MQIFDSWPEWPAAQRSLVARLPGSTVAALARAFAFAEERHGTQTRPAGEPYVRHLLEALEIAVASGANDPDVLVATLLHDVVEDTPCTQDEVRTAFGERVAELVDHVTKPAYGPDTDRAQVREGYLAGFADAPVDVLVVKLSDRYSNVQRLDTHPRPAKRASYYAETVRHFLPLSRRVPFFEQRFAEWDAHFAPVLR